MSDLNYAVFGIGESIYEHFCQAAIDFDDALLNLGAKRLLPVEKSEDDNEGNLQEWLKNLISQVKA